MTMRAEMVLAVRDKLLGPLRRNRQELRNVGREARQMGAGLDRAARASAGLTRGQRQAAQEARRANRTYEQQERILGRLEQRYRNLRNKRMMQGAGLAAGGATATYAGARATMAALRPARGYGTFDEQADAVAAIARVTASGAQDKALRANARELGASTSFSAMQAAQGQEYLALAGFKPDAIIASMRSVLDMAKAGRVEISEAADIASDVGSMFGVDKTAEGMGRLSDVLIGTTTRANTNVSMLFETLKYAGPMARQFGTELETVSAMAGVMADNGVKGSMAGTALQSMFSRLADPPKEAADALKALGVKTADSAGNMRPIVDVLTDINEAASKLQGQKRIAALTAISGLEGAKGFLNIVSDEGLARVRELVKELAKTKGEASEMAERLGDNLPGDVKSFSSAMSELGLVIGEQVAPTLRELIQGATRLVRKLSNWANENPRLVKTLGLAAIALAAFITAGGALATVLGTGLVGLAATRFALQMLGLRAARTGGILRGLKGAATFGFGGMGAAARAAMVLFGGLVGAISWPVLAVVAALASAGVLIRRYWEPISNFASGFASEVQKEVSAAISVVSGFVGDMTAYAGKKLIDFAVWLGFDRAAVEAAFSHAMEGLRNFGSEAIAFLKSLPSMAGDWISSLLTIKDYSATAEAEFATVGQNVARAFIERFKTVFTFPMDLFKGVGREIVTAIRAGLEDGVSGLLDWFSSLPSRIISAIGNIDLTQLITWPKLPKWLGGDGDKNKPAVVTPSKVDKPPATRSNIAERAGAKNSERGAFGDLLSGGGTKPSRPVSVPKFRPQVQKEAAAARADIETVKSKAKTVPQAVRSAIQSAESTLRAVNWATHGERMMATLAQGVRNGGALVKYAVAAELAKARALLPSSNAKEGPLSNLTGNGAAILRTMAQGVNQGGDGGLARALGGKMAAPLLPQLAGAGAAMGGVPATGTGGGTAPAGGGGNTFGNIVFNIYPQSAEDGADQIEARLRQIMHERMND